MKNFIQITNNIGINNNENIVININQIVWFNITSCTIAISNHKNVFHTDEESMERLLKRIEVDNIDE